MSRGFATSAARLERYRIRKLRERGWEGEREAGRRPQSPPVSSNFGHIDDVEAYARANSGSLLRRGCGPRRVSARRSERQDISTAICEETRARQQAEARGAALAAGAQARVRAVRPGAARTGPAAARSRSRAMLRAGA